MPQNQIRKTSMNSFLESENARILKDLYKPRNNVAIN